MRHRLAALLLLGLSLPAGAAAAEGDAPSAAPAPVPPAKAADGKPLPEVRTLRLTLKETLAMALRSNLDLEAASYDPPMAAATLDQASALYDHLFTARVQGGEAKVPVNPAYEGDDGNQASDDFVKTGVAVERLLPWGGRVGISATSDRTLTNSSFAYYNPFWESGLGLNFRQPLLRGFGRDVTESGIRIAEDNRDIAELDYRRTIEEKVRGVEILYWELVRARGILEAREKALEVAEDLAKVNEARLKAGAGTKVDVSQAQAGVAARRVDVMRAGNDLRSLEELLLGEIVPRSPDLPDAANLRFEPADRADEDLPPLPSESLEAAVEDALVRRTDVRLRRVAVDQAEVGVLLAESDALARLDLDAGVSYAGLDRTLGTSWSDSMASREHVSWNVGLVLEIPIGNRAARAALERAVLNRSRLESLVRAEESSAAVRVRNTRRDLESAREQIDAAALSTALAVEQLEAERQRLRNDKSTTFEVLQLESDLTDARLEELRVLTEYRNAVARYDHERGLILQARGIEPPKGAAK